MPQEEQFRVVLSGAEAVARVERMLTAQGFTADPAAAEGIALAGVRAASLSDGSALPASERIPLPGASCVHHVVAPASRARGTVFELAAGSLQQAVDHALVAHRLSARLRRPGLCSLDSCLAERLDRVSLPGPGAVAVLQGESPIEEPHDPDPATVLEEAHRALARVAELTGRAVTAIEYEGATQAEVVFAAVGSACAAARAVARTLSEAGLPAAALQVALVHPFPEADVRAALAAARAVVWVQTPGLGSTVPTRIRASVGEAVPVRAVSATRPEGLLEAIRDLLEPKGVDPASLVSAIAPPPRWRLAVVPVGAWGEQTLREVLAATSRRAGLRMGERSRAENGATVIDWEGPRGPDENADLLVASHPAVLEPEALALLRPGGRVVTLVSAESDEEALRQLPRALLASLRERDLHFHWVPLPGPGVEERGADEQPAGMERAAALVLAGAVVAIVGDAELRRELLGASTTEEGAALWLRRGVEEVRSVAPARLAEAVVADEIDFRPASRAPRLPPSDAQADSEECARWSRAVQHFHRTGRASLRLGPRLPFRPALVDALVARLREAPVYPLVLARTPDAEQPLAARPLREVLGEAVADAAEKSLLHANLGAAAPMAARLAREAGGRLRLDELLCRMATSLGPELGLEGDARETLASEIEALRERLPADAWVMTLNRDLLVQLHATAVEAVRAPLRSAFRARLRGLRERLRDQLQLGLMASPEGHSPGRLAAELGGGALPQLDPEALSRTLPTGPATHDAERQRRMQRALGVIEEELEQGGDERVQTLYFTPPGLALPVQLGLQCEHPDPLAAAVGCFDGAALRMAPLFRAVRTAELELQGRYRPEHHDALLAELDWQGFSAEELALVPPVAAVTSGRRLRRRALGSLSDLLQSSRPVHVLVRDAVLSEDEAEDLSRFHLDLGYLVMAHREAFAVAASLARPERTAEALVRMARAPRPGVAVAQLGSPGLEPWYPLFAEAALRGRACPEFLYDPDAGTSWAGRFDVATNPEPERAWSVERLEYSDGDAAQSLELAFTTAEAACLEPACARHIHVIPRVAWDDEIQLPVADYLERFDPEGRDRSVPYLWVVDDAGVLQRAVLTRALAMAVRDRLRGWRVLQELAGHQNAYAERAAVAAREQTRAEAARERSELERAHAEALAGALQEGARQSMERLATALLRGDALAGRVPAPAPAPSPAPEAEAAAEPVPEPPPQESAPASAEEEEEEALSLDEPYIDSPLCTSCNECTDINPRMFQYNADKQAFLADLAAGTFAELVKAAEKCPAHCIHPGKPRQGDATATPELVERAARFN